MESEEESEERKSVAGKKRKKEGNTYSESDDDEETETSTLGMTSATQTDGIFNDPQAVGKFVESTWGKVKSVRITRNGMVIIECTSKAQASNWIDLKFFNKHRVNVFYLGGKRRRGVRGVVSGVPQEIRPESFLEVDGVCGARRLTRFTEGKREDSKSVCLTFEGDVVPERVYVECVSYRVRPFQPAPLRCYCCQQYGHVAAVCRGMKTCGRCGREGCKTECEGKEDAKCIHCKGEHYTGSAQCPRKVKEVLIQKVRAEKRGMSYAEAVKNVDVYNEKRREPKEQEERRNDHICMDKTRFLAFIAMVINCAIEISRKSERIKMVLEAARRFLNVVDVTGEDLDTVLREEVTVPQT